MIFLNLLFSHLIGDYVLQSDFIAKSKGNNWYHLFVHCVLYCLPFYLFFGFSWQLVSIFSIHFITDALKAKYGIINYCQDQLIHYIACLIYII